MLVPTATDEQKLNYLKQTVQRRPNRLPSNPVQSSNRPTNNVSTRDRTNSSNVFTGGSSDDVDSLFDQSTNYTGRTSRSPSSSVIVANGQQSLGRSSSTVKSNDSLATMQNESQMDRLEVGRTNQRAVDCASVTSSEWGADDAKSEREESTLQKQNTTGKCELSRGTCCY